MVVWLCVYLFKCLLPYFFITISTSMACVDLFKCLLPYYYCSMAVCISL